MMKNKTTKHTLFNISGLHQYPRPKCVVNVNGSEFIQWGFQEMLDSYGITPVPNTIKNPQANSVIEWLHLMLGDHLRCTIFKGTNFIKDISYSHVHLQYEQLYKIILKSQQNKWHLV